MLNERVDTIDSYFTKVSSINTISNWLFVLSIVCSFAVFFSSDITWLNSTLNIVFIVVTVLYVVVSNWVSLFLLRNAQSKRRVHLLSNSFGIKLDDEETYRYYNNPQSPSVIRLGVNVFENTLFTLRVTEEMAKRERVKSILYLFVLLVLILIRKTDLDLIAIVAQTVFTTGLITNWIKLELLRISSDRLLVEFRQLFLTAESNINNKVKTLILSLVFRYESSVASMGVHLSSKIFHKLNSEVTAEWETIKRNIFSSVE
ncbi:hypothetical protein [Planococcus lenghuensis]|uniref:Uncharacterized protein n=1 Tax=Planococcus lenghuensis TaxID=2213202 RepID=A0A1Q2L587_9BACL|nr:hypothetical protein [Planococcus lenghuensis]AQQ55257.1 hypothetical protein B0X71_18925 [Planococcus lenghuensis]